MYYAAQGARRRKYCSHFQYMDVLLEQRDDCSILNIFCHGDNNPSTNMLYIGTHAHCLGVYLMYMYTWDVLREVHRLVAAGCA